MCETMHLPSSENLYHKAFPHEDERQMEDVLPGGLQGSILVLGRAVGSGCAAWQAPATLVVLTSLNAPMQDQPAWQGRVQMDLLVAGIALLHMYLLIP